MSSSHSHSAGFIVTKKDGGPHILERKSLDMFLL